jgi:hypothetical protein
MRTTQAHSKIEDVLAAAGIRMSSTWEGPSLSQMSAADELKRTDDRGQAWYGCEENIAEIRDEAIKEAMLVRARSTEGFYTGNGSNQRYVMNPDDDSHQRPSSSTTEERHNAAKSARRIQEIIPGDISGEIHDRQKPAMPVVDQSSSPKFDEGLRGANNDMG